MNEKNKSFNKVLQSAKKALDSINIPFHLHAGTALGAHREKKFIEHDHDIDLAVFYKDIDSPSKIQKIVKAMEKEGFELSAKLGKLERGLELQFQKNDIPLDIFFVYPGKYKGESYYIISSYYGECDKLKYKTCVWGYRPYDVKQINFLGKKYLVVPKQTLVDMYGKDWSIPKKFDYFEGIIKNEYKGFLKDYYNPRNNYPKVAFCFLLYDTVKHSSLWEKFFAQDNYPEKTYSIYSHLKMITDKTQQWVKDSKINNIKTGWCEENLVWAWIKLLEAGLKDPKNEYFVLLSGEDIPLYNFEETYKKITSTTKSRINISYESDAYIDSGLYWADQWVILNRKCAKTLINLKRTEEGKAFLKVIRKYLGDYCADEIYPINWFVYKFGLPSSKTFKKEFNLIPTTYTYWDGKQPHPIRFRTPFMLKKKKEICSSGALFARKFNSKSAKILGMSCGNK